jgi:hypothetical protein
LYLAAPEILQRLEHIELAAKVVRQKKVDLGKIANNLRLNMLWYFITLGSCFEGHGVKVLLFRKSSDIDWTIGEEEKWEGINKLDEGPEGKRKVNPSAKPSWSVDNEAACVTTTTSYTRR